MCFARILNFDIPDLTAGTKERIGMQSIVPARDCHGALRLAMTWEGSLYAVGSSCTSGDMSPPYGEGAQYGGGGGYGIYVKTEHFP